MGQTTGQAMHGGQSFEDIGEDFPMLERGAGIVNADVLGE